MISFHVSNIIAFAILRWVRGTLLKLLQNDIPLFKRENEVEDYGIYGQKYIVGKQTNIQK